MTSNKANVQNNEFEIQQKLSQLSQALRNRDLAKIEKCWEHLELLLIQQVDQRRTQFRQRL